MSDNQIIITGGGPAGLSAAYFLKQQCVPFLLYEATDSIGGNCKTIMLEKDFLFDTGAHRFHDKNPLATSIVKHLLKDELKLINKPSYMYYNNKYIDFPLSPLNIIKNLSLSNILTATIQVVFSRRNKISDANTFEELAVNSYGKKISEIFLLGYSEKLWGVPPSKLSPKVSGSRLKGLTIKTFLMETFRGKVSKTRHLDGSFYYPVNGYGSICDALANSFRNESVKLNSLVTKFFHDNQKITSLEINNKYIQDADSVINTIPINQLIKLLSPSAPDYIKTYADQLRFRQLILIVITLNKEEVCNAATLYFPEQKYIFTRVYEPKNRSEKMAPKGKTSLVIEVPCYITDPVWTDKSDVMQIAINQLIDTGLVKRKEISNSYIYKMRDAYPVLDTCHHIAMGHIKKYLSRFNNLKLIGRGATFTYSHLHDMILWGKESIETILNDR